MFVDLIEIKPDASKTPITLNVNLMIEITPFDIKKGCSCIVTNNRSIVIDMPYSDLLKKIFCVLY